MLNADTAWKTLSYAACPGGTSYAVTSRSHNSTATVTSNATLILATPTMMPRTSPRPRLLVSVAAASRDRSRIRREISMTSSVAIVMMPNPPTWMRQRITISPKVLQCAAVSTTTSPVTQTAEVDVNSASTSVAEPWPSRAQGSASSPVPTMITAAKPSTTIWAGVQP